MASLAAINNLGDYAHNPRGNVWFNDETTYGHRLLQKMGWNKGKGLGKNENGIKENVKVKFRSANSGLGFKDDAYKNIMKTEYESILKNLHAEYSHNKKNSIHKKETDKPEKDYDQRSKVVKSKLRYPKLFFGKDVTKYSEKDMKSIFICSLPVKDHEETEDIDLTTSQKEKSEIDPSKTYETVNSSLSISDYFNLKMKEKKNNMLNKELNSADHQHVSVGSINHESDNLINNKSGLSKNEKKLLETNTDKEFSGDLGSHQNVSECQNSESKNFNFSSDKKPSKKKKKRKFEMSANGEDSLQKSMGNNDPESHNTMKQDLLEVPVCENSISEYNKISNDDFCRPSKKRKTTHILENENSSVKPCKLLSESINSKAESSSIFMKEKRKKKKKKKINVHLSLSENPASESEKNLEVFKMIDDDALKPEKDILTKNVDCPVKNKKLKKKLKQKLKSCLKKKSDSYSLKAVSFNESVSYRIIDSEFESVECLANQESSVGADTSCEIVTIDISNSSEDGLCEAGNIDNSNEAVNIEDSNSSIDACSVKNECLDEESTSCNICSEGQENTPGEQLDEEEYNLSSLPSSKSPHYNCWIESQRQAMKMKLYENMLKSIKKHKILRTSNLLSIKGYGNWGFK